MSEIDIQSVLDVYGEVEVTLESGFQYELHSHDTVVREDGMVMSTGMQDGEYKTVVFHPSAIEHFSYHDVL